MNYFQPIKWDIFLNITSSENLDGALTRTTNAVLVYVKKSLLDPSGPVKASSAVQ